MIKIVTKNSAAIESALAAANGRARKHTFMSYDDIVDVAIEAEIGVAALGVPVAARAGAGITAMSGNPKPNRNPYIATFVKLRRRTTGWYLLEASISADGDRGWSEISLTASQEELVEAKHRSEAVRILACH